MSTRDLFHFLFETSQVDAATEALLREAEDVERMEVRKTPLLKALKKLGIPTENVTVDADGARLTIPDASLWHEIVRKLGDVDTMNSLADEGWVPEFAGDVADTTELPEYVLNFLPLHDVELSKQDKATTDAALNKEFEGGSDTVIPAEQKARDTARRHGVKESKKKSEVDQLLEADPGWPSARSTPSGQPQGTDAPWATGHSFDHLPDVSPQRGASVRPSWEELPDGSVKITINDPEDLAELKEKVAAGDTSDNLFTDAIDHVLGNGLNLVRPELIGALTDSLILSDVPVNEEGDDTTGAKFWWYPDYQVRSPVQDLAEKGSVIFQSAGPVEPKAAAPAGDKLITPAQVAKVKPEWDKMKDFLGMESRQPASEVDKLLEAPGDTGYFLEPNDPEDRLQTDRARSASFLGSDQPETCRKCGARVEILSGGTTPGEPVKVRCEPCNLEYAVEDDPELDYENPLDAQGKPITVEVTAGSAVNQADWSEFIEANDAMDFAELANIRATLLRGETYQGGGGAAGEYTVRRVNANPNLAPNTALDVQAGNNAAGLNGP